MWNAAMPRFDPATRNNVIVRLQDGQSQAEVTQQFNFTENNFTPLIEIKTGSEVVCHVSLLQPKIGTSGCHVYVIELSLLQLLLLRFNVYGEFPSRQSEKASPTRNSVKKNLCWTNLDPYTRTWTWLFVSYIVIEGLNVEKLVPNSVQWLVTFSSPKMRWTNPRIQASKWEFRPYLRIGCWQIWCRKRRDVQQYPTPQSKPSVCPNKYNDSTL